MRSGLLQFEDVADFLFQLVLSQAGFLQLGVKLAGF